MTAGNFARALELVLAHEGGWADHPKDPGGATQRGVTIGTYSAFLGRPASKAELRAIPDEHLQAIYRKGYWDKLRCDELPAGIDYCAFDAAVNSGPGRAAKWLQEALRVRPDGAVGPVTVFAASTANPALIIERMCDIRMAFLRGLKTFPTFGKGWTRRVAGVEDAAKAMTAPPVPVAKPSCVARIKAAFARLKQKD